MFANTDSVFLSINMLWDEYKIDNKPNIMLLQQMINTFSDWLVKGMEFEFEPRYDYIYIPANKNKYITFEYKDNTKSIPSFDDMLFDWMLNNPIEFVNQINKMGKLKYKSFNYHLIPKYYWPYLDIVTMLWLFYSSIVNETHYIKIFNHIRDQIQTFVDNCDLNMLS